MIFYYFGVAVNLRLVGYYDMAEILYSKFALIVYFVAFVLLCRKRLKVKITNEDNLLMR